MGIIIQVFVWVFTIALQALFYLVMAIIDLLAHIFGGVFVTAADKMHNKKRNKKSVLNTKSKMADMNNILTYVLSKIQAQADARKINLTKTIEKQIKIDTDAKKLSDSLIFLAITCFQLSPVHVDVFCYDYGNYLVAGARCLNVNINVGELEQISVSNENFKNANQMIQQLGSRINYSASGNDVTYSFRLDY